MKAIRIHEFGQSEDVLKYEDVPVPEPKAGEVLIKVEAASLNRADLGLRKGTYRIAADALPVIPGREFAGTIAKLGAGVNEFNVGQRVVGYPSLGGYAEYAVAKVAEVRPVPDGVTAAQAAALPTASLTAWFGLKTDGTFEIRRVALDSRRQQRRRRRGDPDRQASRREGHRDLRQRSKVPPAAHSSAPT